MVSQGKLSEPGVCVWRWGLNNSDSRSSWAPRDPGWLVDRHSVLSQCYHLGLHGRQHESVNLDERAKQKGLHKGLQGKAW